MAARVKDIDRGWKKIVRNVKSLRNKVIEVGIYGNGGDASDNLAERAAVQEYGTRDGRIPSRPFMRQTFDNHKRKLSAVIQRHYDLVVTAKKTPKAFLNHVGRFWTSRVKAQITRGSFEDLSIVTIRRKGSSKPLIDTGEMRRAIMYKVV